MGGGGRGSTGLGEGPKSVGVLTWVRVGGGGRGSTAEMALGARGLGFVLIRRSTRTGH